jgi:lysophospholipase L1-like esterase
LKVFDRRGSGDHDQRVEWPDLDPEALAARLARGDTEHEPERRALVGALRSLSDALGVDCVGGEVPVSLAEVRCVVRAVAEKAPGAVGLERLGDQTGAVRTDSLRGVHDGADPPAREPWEWAYLLLNGLDVPTDARVQTGFEYGFPVDPDEVRGWFPSYLSFGREAVANLTTAPPFVDVGPANARVSIRGRTSATLHEAVSTPAELDAERFRSPGMLFLRGERLEPTLSLVGTGVRYVEQRMAAEHAPPGGFFLVTYGANDLFSFRQVLIGAREVEPAEFEADLRKLDRRTSSLVARGVRRIYVLPPPVDALFERHVLPKSARFTDGTKIPEGSTTLHQWWLAAEANRRLPRQVVLLPAELSALRARQDAFSESAARILGSDGNWLVLDTRALFRAVFARVAGDGISIDAVPGYGELGFQGSPSVLSTDGVHPSPFGYLLWAEMVLEGLRSHGVALRHAAPVAAWMERGLDEQSRAVVERAAEQVRRAPSFFRPALFPLDPTRPEPLEALLDDARACATEGPSSCRAAYARSSFIWPVVPEALLARVAPQIEPALARSTLLHHEIVGRLRRVLERPDAWTAERRAAYAHLLVDFVEKGRSETVQHARLARVSLAAVGMPDDHLERGFRAGHTPGVFSGERVLTLAMEGVGRADARASPSVWWARALVDGVPYRTPPSFLALGVTDFMAIEGHAGLAATRPLSTSSDAALYVEGWLTPLAFSAYIDTLPNLAITVELPSWRPAFGFGERCQAFSARCTALGRFSDGLTLAFWPLRDPAFRAGPWPEPALYAAFRGTYSVKDAGSLLGGGSLEASAGISVGF